ncbi:DUF1289 domain-containing protein [Corticibacter populi]|uniref:DUF1289 domain-containing protein n=1 Tax=Corticibacter populi TaxID=1550736 RepID=A0A3M6R1N4_9BURK|nr:DsbA family protein [Corticibacter populi]RMX08672.1 DUF1289 domain-containing protein [Corticibacter populi]RZS36011.1 2-hydroxychromene-2-carboxylate isomerase [Corticibacter populi]
MAQTPLQAPLLTGGCVPDANAAAQPSPDGMPRPLVRLVRLAHSVLQQGLLRQGGEQALPSPCIGVCRMAPARDEEGQATELCQGCLRRIGEIAVWGQADAGRKRAIWRAILLRGGLRLAQRPDGGAQPAISDVCQTLAFDTPLEETGEDMKHIDFYLDFVSPYAFLAFKALPQALLDTSYHVSYWPVALGGLFKHHGITAPAAVPAKHDWIRRHTFWLAGQQETAFTWPASHPFNSLPLLRLALACSEDGSINRFTAQTVFEHVWCGAGAEALNGARLAALQQALAPQFRGPFALGSEAAKQGLRDNTDAAAAAGVFGVPAFVIGGRMLWGLDALPMLREAVLAA